MLPIHLKSLLWFLGAGLLLIPTEVAPGISSIICLSDNALECFPTLSDRRWSALVRYGNINSSSGVGHGTLNKAALGVSGSEKGSINQQEHPATSRESESSTDQTEKKSHFKSSDKAHACVVVFFDKTTNTVRQRRLFRGSLARRRAGVRRSGSLNSRDQIRASVGSNVEDGINGEWQKGDRDLARVEPYESHAYHKFFFITLEALL